MVRFLTEKEVAAILKISLAKLRKDRFEGKGIPYSKIGTSCRYSEQDVATFMEQTKIRTEALR